MKERFKLILVLIFACILSSNAFCKAENFPASTQDVIDYASNLALSIVDTNFRDSWVIAPEHLNKIEENSKILSKIFNSLGNVKIAGSQNDVRKVLNSPKETRNDGKIWIYGTPNPNGSYEDLIEVFFNNEKSVTGIITFNSQVVVEDIGVSIGDRIEKIIDKYGEPVNEEDFVEDPDNKHYLGLYYLYPRSGIGFLVGQDSKSKDLLVQGVLVFGRS
ncbi:MAG: hypothetical protein HYZ79_00985 [Candidatus Melainabacteria bacterium]|nr:hypothetical protein [Candidatus Melainabacteria bacterium]